jgi:2-keto-4-pentenoate hydratase
VIATSLPSSVLQEFAGRLIRAERQRVPMTALTSMLPGFGVSDAYAVQQAVVDRRVDAGEWVVGWKIGLASKAMQEQLEADEPIVAPILSDWLIREGDPVPVDLLIQPRVQAHIAFELGDRVMGPYASATDVVAATFGLRAAIEVVDSRIEDWRIRLPDTIADLASSARVVVGDRLLPPADLDLRRLGVAVERNGKGVATGQGASIMGNPAQAVAWLANRILERGERLEGGQVVIAGPLHPSVEAARSDVFRALFDRLGSLSVFFV